MHYFEIARQAAAVAMLSVSSYMDVKSRKVSDAVWILFGMTGVVLYIIDPLDSTSTLYAAAGAAIGASWIITRAFGQADGLGLAVLAVILPSRGGIPVAVLASLGAPLLAGISGMCRNVAYNTSDMLHGRLFEGICDRRHRKALAFLVLHRRRRGERFAFPAQDGCRLAFRLRAAQDPAVGDDFCGYVASASPLMPYLLASTLVLLA